MGLVTAWRCQHLHPSRACPQRPPCQLPWRLQVMPLQACCLGCWHLLARQHHQPPPRPGMALPAQAQPLPSCPRALRCSSCKRSSLWPHMGVAATGQGPVQARRR